MIFSIFTTFAMDNSNPLKRKNDDNKESNTKKHQIDFDTLLIEAIQNADVQKVEYALTHTANVNAQVPLHCIPVIHSPAVPYGPYGPLDLSLSCLIRAPLLDSNDTYQKQKAIMKLLVAKNAQLFNINNYFLDVLTSQHHLHDALQLFLNNKIINLNNHDVAKKLLFSAICSYDSDWNPLLPTITTLLERGANPNVDEEDWRAPLYQAVGKKSVPLITLLLEYGAVPHLDALGRATNDCNPIILKLLLEAGAHTQNPGFYGISVCLSAAVQDCSVGCTQLLLKHGAHGCDETLLSNNKFLRYAFTAVEAGWRRTIDNLGVAQLLLLYRTQIDEDIKEAVLTTYKQRLHPLAYAAAFQNNLAHLKALIARCKADDDSANQLANALCWAAGRSQIENVCQLLDAGSNPKKALSVITALLMHRLPLDPTCATLFNRLALALPYDSSDTQDGNDARNFLGKLLARTIKMCNKELVKLFLPYHPTLTPSCRLLDLMHARTLFGHQKQTYANMKAYLNTKLSLKEAIIHSPDAAVQHQLEYGALHGMLPSELANLVQEQQKHRNRITKILANNPTYAPMELQNKYIS